MELAKHLGAKIMVTTGGTNLRDDILRIYQRGKYFFFPKSTSIDVTFSMMITGFPFIVHYR